MADAAVAPLSRHLVVLAPRARRILRLVNVGAVGVLVCIAALHVWSLMRFPAPFVDEAWTASRGWALASRGETIGSLDKGVVDRFPSGWAFFPLFPTLVHASALAIAGAPSLFAVRLVSLVGGAALALALWFIASRFSGPGTAWLAVVLLTVSGPFVNASHLARPDVLAAALGYGGVALFLSGGGIASGSPDQRSQCIACRRNASVLGCHRRGPTGPCHLGVGGQPEQMPAGRALLVGLIAGAVLWSGIHLLPDLRGYIELTKVLFGATHPTFSLSGWLEGPWDAMRFLLDTYLWVAPIPLWAMAHLLDPVDWPIASANPHDNRIVFLSVLVRPKSFYYAILIAPAVSLCMAAAISNTLAQRRISPTFSLAWLTVCAALLMKSFSLVVGDLAFDSFQVYERVQNRVASNVKIHESIMGSQTYWFGLHQHDYYSWEQLVFLQRSQAGSSTIDGLVTMRPDVFVAIGRRTTTSVTHVRLIS